MAGVGKKTRIEKCTCHARAECKHMQNGSITGGTDRGPSLVRILRLPLEREDAIKPKVNTVGNLRGGPSSPADSPIPPVCLTPRVNFFPRARILATKGDLAGTTGRQRRNICGSFISGRRRLRLLGSHGAARLPCADETVRSRITRHRGGLWSGPSRHKHIFRRKRTAGRFP